LLQFVLGLPVAPLVRKDAAIANFPVDVVVLADFNYIAGVAAIINAARKLTSAPVRFWIGFDGEPTVVTNYLRCVGIDQAKVTVRRQLTVLNKNLLKSLASKAAARLQSPANFARFALPQLFPELKSAWYFDADVIPLGDLAPPLRKFEVSGAAICPVIRRGTIASQFPSALAIQAAYRKKYNNRTFHTLAPSWNAGVWMADFSKWTDRNIKREAIEWVNIKAAHKGSLPLWKLATQPLMYLLFHEDVRSPAAFLQTSWNCEAYMYRSGTSGGCVGGCILVDVCS
jgi:lipopolysaccharide biosynthesis glycosyltransferase